MKVVRDLVYVTVINKTTDNISTKGIVIREKLKEFISDTCSIYHPLNPVLDFNINKVYIQDNGMFFEGDYIDTITF